MDSELFWLNLTLASSALFSFPYVLNRLAVRGLAGVVGNPSEADLPLARWAQRAQRAHVNAIENLVLFVPAALEIHLLQLGDSLTATACALYFVSRLLHYVVYTAGIPVVRTLAFFGGWIAIAILLARLFRVL